MAEAAERCSKDCVRVYWAIYGAEQFPVYEEDYLLVSESGGVDYFVGGGYEYEVV
jgi:hypothetical protein